MILTFCLQKIVFQSKMIFISLSLCFQNKKRISKMKVFQKKGRIFTTRNESRSLLRFVNVSRNFKDNSKNDKISKQRLNPCFAVSLQFIAGLNSITGHFDNLNLSIIKAFTCRKGHLTRLDSEIPQ